MRAVVAAALVVGLSLFAAGPAAAADTGAPNWYTLVAGPKYAPAGPPAPLSVDNSGDPTAETNYEVSLFSPEGGGPSQGVADIQVQARTTSTDTARIPLDATPAVSKFGTVLDAFAPDAASGAPLSVSATASGNTIVLHRPDPVCKLPDNWRYSNIRVALLTVSAQGKPQRVMLTVDDLQFKDRRLAVKAECATEGAAKSGDSTPDPTATSTSAPTTAQGYVDSKIDAGKKKVDDTETAAKSKADAAKDKVKSTAQDIKTRLTEKVSHPDFGPVIGWAVFIGLVVALGWLLYKRHKSKSDEPRKTNKPKPKSKADSTETW